MPRLKQCRAEGCEKQIPRGLQQACSYPCALKVVAQKREKKYKAETRAMKREFNEKDRSYQIEKTKTACHKYILKRDERDACISCGIQTGQMTAGHFYTVGHAPELRWHPDNIHKQCGQCNFHKAGNIPTYRINLEKKIGRDRVENLERCRTPQNWTLDDIKEIGGWYREQLQRLNDLQERNTIGG